MAKNDDSSPAAQANSDPFVALGFRVKASFRDGFHMFCARHRVTHTVALYEGLRLLDNRQVLEKACLEIKKAVDAGKAWAAAGEQPQIFQEIFAELDKYSSVFEGVMGGDEDTGAPKNWDWANEISRLGLVKHPMDLESREWPLAPGQPDPQEEPWGDFDPSTVPVDKMGEE